MGNWQKIRIHYFSVVQQFLSFLKKYFIYLCEREREKEIGGRRGRRKSRLHAQRGVGRGAWSQDPGWDHDLSRRQMFNWAIQVSHPWAFLDMGILVAINNYNLEVISKDGHQDANHLWHLCILPSFLASLLPSFFILSLCLFHSLSLFKNINIPFFTHTFTDIAIGVYEDLDMHMCLYSKVFCLTLSASNWSSYLISESWEAVWW